MRGAELDVFGEDVVAVAAAEEGVGVLAHRWVFVLGMMGGGGGVGWGVAFGKGPEGGDGVVGLAWDVCAAAKVVVVVGVVLVVVVLAGL